MRKLLKLGFVLVLVACMVWMGLFVWERHITEEYYETGASHHNLGADLEEEGENEDAGREYREAIYWYKKAAERGHNLALVNLAKMYYGGEGVPVDREKARRFMQEANK